MKRRKPRSTSRHHQEMLRQWDKNRMYYYAHKKELLRKYRGLYIAIWDERVADFDKDRIALTNRVYATIGYKPIFITQVTPEPRIVRVPSYIELGRPLKSAP